MPHHIGLILTLTGGFTAALALGFATHKLRLSPIVGYLLAGMLVGPFTPGYVADNEIATQFAEIGVILLMFGVGLHFHLKDLLAVRTIAIPGAIFQIAIASALGAIVTRMFGWSWTAGIVYGMAISVASTVVLTRVLADNRDLHTPSGHIAIGWLIVEDLFTILVLVLLPALFGATGDSGGGVWMTLCWALLKLTVLVAFALIAGQKIIPWFLGYVARTGARDLFTLAVLVLALGIAVGSAQFFGASMALGAFLAGEAAVYGDASEREILHHAGIEKADGLIIAASGVPADAVMKAARELNPKIRILTRTTYLRETTKLREAGANAVFSSEGEIALSMTEFVMRQIGATDEQIDRERDRVRKELFPAQLERKCSRDAPPGSRHGASVAGGSRSPASRTRLATAAFVARNVLVWRVEQRSWKFDPSCQRDPPTPICLLPKTAHRSFAHAA